jgi:thioredoxin 1
MRSIITFLLILFSSSILAQSKMSEETKPLITFVELGSVRCVPCIQMQPIMKSIEQKYGAQIKVIFYDVWTDEGHEYAEIYKIQLIPTQVFLDENDKEIFRHVGFFPEVEIDKFLQERGLTIIK